MALNPIKTTQEITKQYTKYLNSLFFLKDKELAKQAEEQLTASGKFVKGPFVEITPPFIEGDCINTLIKNGILSNEFEEMRKHFPLERPLYAHQEKAIKKIVIEESNAIIATGTGSGKTECFMIPVINYLMKQKEKGQLNKGVRALFLYPMNALANDQISRLRIILEEYPDITFGRFVGETEEKEERALETYKKMHPNTKKIKNEIISREEMRKGPPHILLTNYAMLEYLLLRPSDNVFFDGEYANEWKFIIMDEVHTYKGAKGTEISMLIRRLKQRVIEDEVGKIRCIATSATLGGGKDSYNDVALFAQDIFGEKFNTDDIIEAERVDLNKNKDRKVSRTINEYDKLSLLRETKNYSALYNELRNDINVIMLQEQLSSEPRLLSDIAKTMFEEKNITYKEKEDAIVNLVDLCAMAKNKEDDLSLLPARYHVFVKSLEGAYVVLYPNKKLYLDRHITEKLPDGRSVPVFELANCQRCGQEYVVGTTIEKKLCNIRTHAEIEGIRTDRVEYYMLGDFINNEFDDDEMMFEDTNKTPNVEECILCCGCGHIDNVGALNKMNCCSFPSDKYIKVWRVKTRESKVNTCFNCGAYSPGIVKRFLTADDPATEVLARALYHCIPPKKDNKGSKEEINDEGDFFEFDFDTEMEDKTINDEQGRKLLIFSDNRQEAAFFASYMNLKYNQVLWRNCIINVMNDLRKYDDIRIESLAARLLDYGEEKHLFPNVMDDPQKLKTVYLYILKEFLSVERQIGLEGLGVLSFIPQKPMKWGNIPAQKELGVNQDEMWEIYCMLFDTLRTTGAVTFPKDVSPIDEFFAPRNKNVYFKLEAQESFKDSIVLGWLPKEKTSNRRLDYITKILVKNSIDKQEAKIKARKILKDLLSTNALKFFINSSYIKETHIPNQGTLLQFDYGMWQVKLYPSKLYRCEACGIITVRNIKNVCPSYRCEGQLKEYSGQKTRFTYFKELYEDMKSIPMLAREHTAQLTSTCASKLQKDFEKGAVNILSCSTTFEMGVDVGQLEGVFMRNVPPETANYIQRAGRAGRRTESTAYSLTYAKRRSHDLTYFQHPQNIISGKIQPPYIEMNNDKIIKRHLYSVVFAWFFKLHPEYFGKVDEFFSYSKKQKSAIDVLIEELEKRPYELIEALEIVIPNNLHDYFGLEDWKWASDLIDKNEGLLFIAKDCLYDILYELSELEDRLRAERKMTDSILRIINTYLGKGILDFLSTNNILPKYGFPVDVVELNVLHHGSEAKNISLSRDLKLAISEFAPGSEIIANGKVWKPYAINKSSTKGWPVCEYAICKACKKIYKYESDLGVVNEEKLDNCCGLELNYSKFIKPVFGFSTNTEPPKEPGEKRASKFYSTQIIFDSFVEDENSLSDIYEGSEQIGISEVRYKYSSRGRLVLLNQGFNKTGFSLCRNCGYVKTTTDNTTEVHKTKIGNRCNNTFLYNVHFGHEFITDVLELKLPVISNICMEDDFWLSLLYAVIEGTSISLGISRNEINGCLYYNDENDPNIPSLMLFDDVPGGAGHVKKISKNIKEVLSGARRKVIGSCGCGEETSCYGCLRSYSNQIFHDNLQRGLALNYLNDILCKETVYESKLNLSITQKHVWIMEYIKEKDFSMPEINYVLKDKYDKTYRAQIVWPEHKIAFFEGLSSSYQYFQSKGYICFDINRMPQNELKKEIHKCIG